MAGDALLTFWYLVCQTLASDDGTMMMTVPGEGGIMMMNAGSDDDGPSVSAPVPGMSS
jgi:hypothetical protein